MVIPHPKKSSLIKNAPPFVFFLKKKIPNFFRVGQRIYFPKFPTMDYPWRPGATLTLHSKLTDITNYTGTLFAHRIENRYELYPVFADLFVLYCKISLTTEPIWFSLQCSFLYVQGNFRIILENGIFVTTFFIKKMESGGCVVFLPRVL